MHIRCQKLIKSLREREGLTATQLAESLGVSLTMIARYENTDPDKLTKWPTPQRVEQLVKALKATPQESAELRRLAIVARSPEAAHYIETKLSEAPAVYYTDQLDKERTARIVWEKEVMRLRKKLEDAGIDPDQD